MDAFALLPDEEREAYFQEAAAQMGLPVASRISEVAKDLDSMKEMFFGSAPGIDQVLGTLEHWERAFNNKTDRE